MQTSFYPSLLATTTQPIALYSSEQIYTMEQAWFAEGHDSFGLMKQAAWQMAKHIEWLYTQSYLKTEIQANIQTNIQAKVSHADCQHQPQRRAHIWVGKGNNGGDGCLIAYYLQQVGWQVQVTTVGFEKSEIDRADLTHTDDKVSNASSHHSDATKARQIALSANVPFQRFEDKAEPQDHNEKHQRKHNMAGSAEVYIDALFGIGLTRAPEGTYAQAIEAFNCSAQYDEALAIAVDMPSGLVASTGQVFERMAVQADVTLCLIARKFGLHTKDGMDYSGAVIDIPLIPYQMHHQDLTPVATLMATAHCLKPRRQNSYKGSYGHVLVIGGNRVDGSQGMGGAAILSAASTMATGAGKITVACHEAFHGALLTSLPDAMTINLHDKESVKHLIKDASLVVMGMGLGRDKKAKERFVSYLKAAIADNKTLVIDADGLYHLAELKTEDKALITQLRDYSADHHVCFTPHSGEAARLLGKEVDDVENDRLAAIKQCAAIFGGEWVLKGAGSLVWEQHSEQSHVYVCGAGNAGMASAGMGDVLSGVIAGLLAQQDLTGKAHSLHQAVLIHAMAGDHLVKQISHGQDKNAYPNSLLISQRGLQAQDMPAAIRHVMQLMTSS